MCCLTHTHTFSISSYLTGEANTPSLSPQERLYLQIKSYDLGMTESLWIALHTTAFFTSSPSPAFCLFSSLFLQQGAGLVRSSSSTISLRCTLPSCCFPLIKELLDKWLGRTESSAESNIFPAAAQRCMPMTAKWRWEKITLGLRDDRGCAS